MPESSTKTIRVSDDVLEHIQALIGLSPDLKRETDVLVRSVEIGHLVLAALAARPSGTPYGGYDPADLAVLLRNYLLPVFEFLAQQQALPTLMAGYREGGSVGGGQPGGTGAAGSPPQASIDDLSTVMDANAGTAIEETTGGFL